MTERTRHAACSCGAVKIAARGAPEVVNACACHACQRRSGSSFTYTAFFPTENVTIEGETKAWREGRDAGRWHEARFCTECGCSVLAILEAFPHLTGVSVGAFNDGTFDAPGGFYWATQRHHWLPDPLNIKVHQTQ